MRRIRYLFTTFFLLCMVICLSAPRLWAGECSETATETTPTDALTPEEILPELDPSKRILLDDNFYLGDLPSQIDPELLQEKGLGVIGDLPDTFSNAKKPPMLDEDGEPSKYSDEHGDWYWGTDGHLYPWPPPGPQPEVTRHPDGKVTTKYPDGRTEIKEPDGTIKTYYPNGTFILQYPDGFTATVLPNGRVINKKTTKKGHMGKTITEYPEGKVVTTYSDGTTQTDYYTDGRSVTQYPDGKKVTRYPDGKVVIEQPDGTTEVEEPDTSIKIDMGLHHASADFYERYCGSFTNTGDVPVEIRYYRPGGTYTTLTLDPGQVINTPPGTNKLSFHPVGEGNFSGTIENVDGTTFKKVDTPGTYDAPPEEKPKKPVTEAGTDSEVDSVVDDLQPSVSASAASGDITADEALEKWEKKAKKVREEASYARILRDAAEHAAIKLKLAIDDAMDAEPGSEEAREAAKKVKEAAKKAQELAEEAEKQMQKYEEAKEEADKAYKEFEEASDREYEAEKAAREEAAKQNKAAGEAAKKAYEATGHGTSNKK